MTPSHAGRVLYRDAALADGQSGTLTTGVSVLVDAGRLVALWTDGEEPAAAGAKSVDASGATLVPGLVDSHSHLTMPGGARWIDRGGDPTDDLLDVAEEAGDLLVRSGVRWARDVGSPRGRSDAGGRAVSLDVRDAWHGRRDRPYVRAAGTWLARPQTLPSYLPIEVSDADELVAAATDQLDDGADLIKLYLDGPDRDTSPFTADEIRRVVDVAHGRGARVAAHAGALAGARAGAEAGVDSLEHGFEIDSDIAALMGANGVTLVSTLAVLESFLGFASTTRDPRFTDNSSRTESVRERARESVRIAHCAGVAIAAGSDSGGGSLRHGQLAWEVEALTAAGLEPWEALAAATWRGGDLIGEPGAGRLVVGGPADAFFVHGDPLRDPGALWRVWRVL